MKKFIRLISGMLCAVMMLCTVTIGYAESNEEAPTTTFDPNTDKVWSEAVYMANMDTGDVVYKKNETKKMYPASTTKIMTAIIVLENVRDLRKKVEAPYDCFDEFNGDDPNKWGASHAAIEPLQENLTYLDCLYGLMLPSGCDAANILAYNVGKGNMQTFFKMMNDKAKEIGCTCTNFSNAHGLYEDTNYTTAQDMFLITKYAYEHCPKFWEICGTYEYEMPPNTANPNGYYIYNTVSLINPASMYYYEGAMGIKTGTIDQGGRCLVSAVKKNYTYMLVTLNAPIYDSEGEYYDDWYNMVDAINLYNWAFENFAMATLQEKNEQITEVDVALGENASHVILVPENDFMKLMPKNIDASAVQKTFKKYDMVQAPVEKGDVLGVMDIKFKGETLTSINLVASNSVIRSETEYYIERLKIEVNKTWVKISVVLFVILLICTIVTRTVENSRKRKSRAKERRKYSHYANRR